MKQFYFSYLAAIVLLSLSCGEQQREVEVLDLRSNADDGIALIVDGGTNNITIGSGPMAGAGMQFSAGALALGTQVSIGSATSYNWSDVKALEASGAISYKGTDESGNPVYTLNEPGTFSLPVNGISGAGLTANSYAELCILAQPSDSSIAECKSS